MVDDKKIIKVEVYVDTTKQEQIEALSSLLFLVGGSEPAQRTDHEPTPEPEKKPSRTRSKKEAEKKDPEPTPAPEAEPEDKDPEPETKDPEPTPAPEEEGPKWKVEQVREKLKEKVQDHRDEIKSKLSELGAPNVSSLDPEKYNEFMEFLDSLS